MSGLGFSAPGVDLPSVSRNDRVFHPGLVLILLEEIGHVGLDLETSRLGFSPPSLEFHFQAWIFTSRLGCSPPGMDLPFPSAELTAF